MSYGMLRLLTVYSRRGGASVIRHVTLVDSLLGRGGVERVSYSMLRLLTVCSVEAGWSESYGMLRWLPVYSVEAGWSECHTACYVGCQFTRSRRGGASVIRHVTFVDSLLGLDGAERVSNDMLRLLTVDSVEAGWSECHTACYVC